MLEHDAGKEQPLKILEWSTLPKMPQLEGPTIPNVGRTFFIHSQTTLLKLKFKSSSDGEAEMTRLAHSILPSVVPSLIAIVNINDRPRTRGLLLARRCGAPLAELWPTLSPVEKETVKSNLTRLLVRMRAPNKRLSFYGRPGLQPYITPNELGAPVKHAFCRSRTDWDTSRIGALVSAARDLGMDENRTQQLKRLQCETASNYRLPQVDRPVLVHGDLSDRNILVDPETLEVSGFLDWEMANVAPAYFEYTMARLSGGHDKRWRQVLLGVLREVLKIECEHEVAQYSWQSDIDTDPTKIFAQCLDAWNTLVDVERVAQGYSDECYWTFEDD